ncbi:hypothetical protein XELAEV_18027872mg [Xenopus laevis]|uniref:Uncharacterized protein n=1 Tax=Xenopus laevis TaxID=8355 RepID=A0A974CYK0_XENLA|nr:hypothetical protein XELAEV_18027872mg [Xenopus laevis]
MKSGLVGSDNEKADELSGQICIDYCPVLASFQPSCLLLFRHKVSGNHSLRDWALKLQNKIKMIYFDFADLDPTRRLGLERRGSCACLYWVKMTVLSSFSYCMLFVLFFNTLHFTAKRFRNLLRIFYNLVLLTLLIVHIKLLPNNHYLLACSSRSINFGMLSMKCDVTVELNVAIGKGMGFFFMSG